MDWLLDAIFFIIGILHTILSYLQIIDSSMLYGIIWTLIYPVLIEWLLNMISTFNGKKYELTFIPRSHIVYRKQYNIDFGGLEKMHPFDSFKYGNIFRRLVQSKIIDQKQAHIPNKISRLFLLEKMSKFYLLTLNYTIPICMIVQSPFLCFPSFFLRRQLLNPMLFATQGTLMACSIALKLRWSVNLSGGYHHASFDRGGGFCFYPDISLAIHYLRTRMGIRRIMIIDCDAHQGNGYGRDFVDDTQIYIIDVYNHRIYPQDKYARSWIAKDISVSKETTDEEYIELLGEIESDMKTFDPEFVIYNAGTDILQGDVLGKLEISAQGVKKRDQIVFRMCIQRETPITMLLSGGYQKNSSEIIAESISNLYSQFG